MSSTGRDRSSGASTAGDHGEPGASGHALNRRLRQASNGVSKAVTGREDLIRAQAARAASKLDAKTEGRHHEKLRVALHVLDVVIDRFGEPDERSRRSAHQFESARGDRAASGRSASSERAADEPEDLGEVRAERTGR